VKVHAPYDAMRLARRLGVEPPDAPPHAQGRSPDRRTELGPMFRNLAARQTVPMKSATEEELRKEAVDGVVARRAYELWEQDGRAHGNDLRHWEEAKRQLQGTPAPHGNPAYPPKAERDRIVAENTGRDEPVKKIPGDALRRKR
jgi:hypothetical protein